MAWMREDRLGQEGALLIPHRRGRGPLVNVNRASVPWSVSIVRKKGRPRKEQRYVGCVWPGPHGVCGAQRAPDIALCAAHSEIVPQRTGYCAWPGCVQSSFHRLCEYHRKCACGLIELSSR